MNMFGQSLRSFRNRCNDPDHLEKRLSQERFGELIGRELGVFEGYSGAAVSDWERGKSAIHATDRFLLVCMLKVLYRYGGITRLEEANQLLWAGNFRSLDQEETQAIFSASDLKQDGKDVEKLSEPIMQGIALPNKNNDAGPRLWPPNISDESYYHLPHREQYLDELLDTLSDAQGPRVISIDGLGGLGKTALATELARRTLQKGLFQGVIGETAKQEILADGEIVQLESAILKYETLLNALARQLHRWDLFTVGPAEKEAALGQILHNTPYLILVDNLETAQNANTLVARLKEFLGPSRAILTSRSRVRFSFTRSLTLDGLAAEDSVFFLRSAARELKIEQLINAGDETLHEIHQTTGGSPLAMKLIAAQARFLDLPHVLDQLRKTSSPLFPFIFQQSWNQLSVSAQSVLIYIGRAVMETVSFRELSMVAITESEDELITAIDQLTGLSLLNTIYKPDQIRYSIHQLTRQFVVSDLPGLWREQGLL